MMTEWRSRRRLHAIMVACLALEAIMKDQVESESQQQQWVSTKKPRRNEKCEIVCKDPGGGLPYETDGDARRLA